MRYSPHPNVVARSLDGSAVLVHLDTSRIFTLNATGSRIWELLSADEAVDLTMLLDALRVQYEVDDDELHGDVLSVLRHMEHEKLVVAFDGQPPC